MAAVEAHGLGYTYGDGMEALADVDLAIREGEKVAVVGGNGAGKSTLLELLAGFRFPFTGRVRILGVELTSATAAAVRRNLGLVFQDPDDQVFMPRVWDDVAFGPRNLGWTEDRVRGAVERVLGELEIRDLADRVPHRLSYGQKKRVALAGVLAMDPPILLLDEPSGGLDHRTRADFLRRLAAMPRTMVIATHHVEEVAGFVDRIVVLRGTKLADGPPREILARDDLLAAANLEPPPIPELFRALRRAARPVAGTPLSVDEAVALLSEYR